MENIYVYIKICESFEQQLWGSCWEIRQTLWDRNDVVSEENFKHVSYWYVCWIFTDHCSPFWDYSGFLYQVPWWVLWFGFMKVYVWLRVSISLSLSSFLPSSFLPFFPSLTAFYFIEIYANYIFTVYH